MVFARLKTKFRVRLKTKTKLKIFFSLLTISSLITFVGLSLFDSVGNNIEYDKFFESKVNRVLRSGGQFYYGAVRYNGRTYKVQSNVPLRLDQKVCVGRVESVLISEFKLYKVVDYAMCK